MPNNFTFNWLPPRRRYLERVSIPSVQRFNGYTINVLSDTPSDNFKFKVPPLKCLDVDCANNTGKWYKSFKSMKEHYNVAHMDKPRLTKDTISPLYVDYDSLTCPGCLTNIQDRTAHIRKGQCSDKELHKFTTCTFCKRLMTFRELAYEHIDVCPVGQLVNYQPTAQLPPIQGCSVSLTELTQQEIEKYL